MPRTKFVAPYPDARFDGRLEIDGETIELSGWPGMIGHNWGSEHAERWVWLEGTGFEGADGTYFDAGAARIKLGSWTTPWIPSGMLMLDGEAHRLGGFGKIRAASIEESPTACEFVLPGKDVVVRGRVSGPAEGLRRLGLRRPEGARAQHGQLLGRRPRADGRTPGPPGRASSSLAAGAAYEFGMRETDHGIPIQPYPGRLSAWTASARAATGWIWAAVVPIAFWALMRTFGLDERAPCRARRWSSRPTSRSRRCWSPAWQWRCETGRRLRWSALRPPVWRLPSCRGRSAARPRKQPARRDARPWSRPTSTSASADPTDLLALVDRGRRRPAQRPGADPVVRRQAAAGSASSGGCRTRC